MSVPTYVGTVDRYCLEYYQRLETEQISPFLIPAHILNHVLLIACLTITQRLPLASKIVVFLAIVAISVLSLQTSRTLGLAHAILIGVSSFWCITLPLDILFLHSRVKDFRRVIAYDSTSKHDSRPRSGIENRKQWQSIPTSFHKRLFWNLDLLGSLRALHWSYGHSSDRISTATCTKCPDNPSSIQRHLGKLLHIYLCTDCLDEVIAMDPYFWGYIEYNPPDYIKSGLRLPCFIQTYRMLVAFAVIYIAIKLVSTVGILILVDILGPSMAGTWGNRWAYRPQFGDFDSICTKGLQGWWGAWWHQMF